MRLAKESAIIEDRETLKFGTNSDIHANALNVGRIAVRSGLLLLM